MSKSGKQNESLNKDGIQQEILSALKLADFIALDIETTGLDYQKEDIIEFAAVHFQHGEIIDSIDFFIHPTRSIPPHITRITGISNEDVAGAPSFSEVFPRIKEFINDYPLVVHNVNFDLPFLEYHVRRIKGDMLDWNERTRSYRYFHNPKYDTITLARLYLPFLQSFRLGAVAEYFQLVSNREHRALPDAEIAGKIFLELVQIALRTRFADVQKILQILEPTADPIKEFFQNLILLLASGKYHIPEGIPKETFTVSANFYNIIGEDETPSRGKLETGLIDVESVAHFFDEQGDLSREFTGFENRPQQTAMARAIAQAFNESKFLIVEAGTGTGKSLAYLVPAIKWATRNYGPYGRVIISTNTKNLQEQLFFKDLPILHNILKEKFKVVLLKGKANYLCLDKWVTILNDIDLRLNVEERRKILPLYLWVQRTQTGDIAENNGFHVERNIGLWTKFTAENNYCLGKGCKFYDRCFLIRARNNARDAHLVLVNHSLLFSDLATEQAILADYTNVIFDEAHNIEKTATEYLGYDISPWQFRDFYNKLYSKDKMETGVLAQLKKRLQLSNMKKTRSKTILRMVEDLTPQVQNCWKMTQGFFRELTRILREKIPQNSTFYNSKHRYTREDQLFKDILDVCKELTRALKKLQSQINDMIEYFKELPEESFNYQRQIYQELNAQFMQGDLLLNNLQFLIAAEWDNYIYWFELPSRPDSYDSRLYAAPLDIAGILNERLYSRLKTAIFTSATLAVNRRFEYFMNRVGIQYVPEERVETLLLDSPFNYQEQVFLTVPSFMADPRNPEYPAQVKAFLEKMVLTHPRGTLVLFTSYAMLNRVYEAVRLTFEAENVQLLGQGIDGSRHSIINQFKTVKNSFLFGTDSFWEGVDVPGEALEVLLITRLPFDVPSEPLIQAKAELIRKQGGNPFMDFTIPEAVIRFRQGFGRLIRTRSDYGAIIILDTRVVKRLYGRIFLQSLPLQTKIFPDEEEFWQQFKKCFA